MDGGKKKRKMEDAEQDENEEVKMKEFFSLIKSSREVRERLAGAAAESKSKDNPSPAATATAWNPTFRLEDFVEAPLPAPPQETEKAGPAEEVEKRESGEKSGDKGLDLNLSL